MVKWINRRKKAWVRSQIHQNAFISHRSKLVGFRKNNHSRAICVTQHKCLVLVYNNLLRLVFKLWAVQLLSAIGLQKCTRDAIST